MNYQDCPTIFILYYRVFKNKQSVNEIVHGLSSLHWWTSNTKQTIEFIKKYKQTV